MLYESAARADEVLCLNVEDLYPVDNAEGSPPRRGDRVDSLAIRHRSAW